jgi:hypothetical protein
MRAAEILKRPAGAGGRCAHEFTFAFAGFKNLKGYKDIGDFVQSLEKPRWRSHQSFSVFGSAVAAMS